VKLAAEKLRYAYVHGSDVLHDVSITVDGGTALFILGANGCGKTTLLDCLSGLRTPHSGEIRIDGTPLQDLSVRERARRIGVVPQLHEPVFSYRVEQIVLMGRAPHLGLFAQPGHGDLAAVDAALEAVGAVKLRDRPYTQISGGERQLVLVARGLAQGAGCLLMDEPAAHLDPQHQQGIYRIVRRLVEEGFAFVITSHHPNDALLYADRVLFLAGGAVIGKGTPDAAIDEQTLRAAYGMDFELVRGALGTRAVLPCVGTDHRAA